MLQGNKIVKPSYLQAGDKVALVAPAYWVAEEAVSLAADILRSWGLVPIIGEHTRSLNVDAYSGTADERAGDLLWAFQDDDIRAIFCSRGGYGSLHLLRRILPETVNQHPKWLIGHGDITILINAIAASGVMSLYGPMAFQLAAAQEPSLSITRDILFGTLPEYHIPPNPYNRCGHAEGVLVGGNLASYAAIAATDYHVPADEDIILFIEEVEESLHSIDRLFYSLTLRLDFLQRVKGIILGSFCAIRYDLQFGSVEQMLTAHFAAYDIPVCCGFPVGSNSCLPLLVGSRCTLDVAANAATLTFHAEGNQRPCLLDVPEAPLFQ